MSKPDDPCPVCGAQVWRLAERHDVARHYRVPVYRCGECNHEYEPVLTLVGSD